MIHEGIPMLIVGHIVHLRRIPAILEASGAVMSSGISLFGHQPPDDRGLFFV